MSDIIILPGTPIKGEMAKDANRVVKKHRGVSRPFIMLVHEAGGEVTILSNMDRQHERIDMLVQVANKLKAMS